MKTNVTLISTDRSLCGVTIRQQSKTGFLNLSDLQEAYTQSRVKNGWMDKRIDHILTKKENAERIFYVLAEQQVINVPFHTFMEQVELQGLLKVLKSYEVYKTTGARHTKTTWVNDSIWILAALELSPVFYAKTISWLKDDLIINRIEAGNFCKALNSSMQKFNPTANDYITISKAINHVIFGKHEAGIRNTGTKKQLKDLSSLEEKMAFAIDMGYINTCAELVNQFRMIYNNKQLIRN